MRRHLPPITSTYRLKSINFCGPNAQAACYIRYGSLDLFRCPTPRNRRRNYTLYSPVRRNPSNRKWMIVFIMRPNTESPILTTDEVSVKVRHTQVVYRLKIASIINLLYRNPSAIVARQQVSRL